MNDGPLLKEEKEKLFVDKILEETKEENKEVVSAVDEKPVVPAEDATTQAVQLEEPADVKLKVSESYPDLKTFKESVAKKLSDIPDKKIIKKEGKNYKALITTCILGALILALFGSMIVNVSRGIKYRDIINDKLTENIEKANQPKIRKR